MAKSRENISMTFDPTTIEALKAAAAADQRPVSVFAERAIRAFLNAQSLTGSAARS